MLKILAKHFKWERLHWCWNWEHVLARKIRAQSNCTINVEHVVHLLLKDVLKSNEAPIEEIEDYFDRLNSNKEDLLRYMHDSFEYDKNTVYDEFKEQLVRDKKGCYERGLLWSGAHPVLPSYKQESIPRLISLNKATRTTRVDKRIWSNHWGELGVVEDCPREPAGHKSYIRHKRVVREGAPNTKLRVVYHTSARAHPNAPSLNEVMERDGSSTLVLCGDIQKAFLRTGIKEQERDALRSHWRLHEGCGNETYRFTRVLFGLTGSPFFLWGSYWRVFVSLRERDAGNCRGITQQPVRRWFAEWSSHCWSSHRKEELSNHG